MTRLARSLLAVLCATVGLLGPVPSGRVATAAPVTGTYSSGPLNRQIPDLGYVEQSVQVSDAGPILDVNARVRINHTYVYDLDLFLRGPDGTEIALSIANGGDGDNYGAGPTNCSGTFTTFDDQAGTSIVTGTAPFAGTFRPEESLATFNGKSAAGTWTLIAADNEPQDTGTLFCWELQITREVAAPPPPPPPPPAQADLSISLADAPDPVRGGANLTYTAMVANSGPAAATAATATLNLPPDVAFVSATSTQGSCAQGTGNVVCNLGTVAAGATVTISVVVRSPAITSGTASLSSAASVQSSVTDPVPGNNSTPAQATAVYSCEPRPVVTQTAVADGPGRVRVTVSATSTPGAPANRLREIQFGPAPNTHIEVDGQTRPTPYNLVLPNRPEQTVFYIRRGNAPGAFTVPFVIVDDCGGRSSFAGGGVSVP